jgi:hypothetical protein
MQIELYSMVIFILNTSTTYFILHRLESIRSEECLNFSFQAIFPLSSARASTAAQRLSHSRALVCLPRTFLVQYRVNLN